MAIGEQIIGDTGGITLTIGRIQEIARERDWTLHGFVTRVSDATERVIAEHLQDRAGNRDSVSPFSMSALSENSAASRFLLNLTNTLDRDALRGFLTSLPTRSVNRWLAKADPEGMTREDFLANLPADAVNKILLSISEAQMSRFVADVVPQDLRDAIMTSGAPSTSSTSLNVHWIY